MYAKRSEVERWELSGGTRVVFRPIPGAKVAAIYAAVPGGLWTESLEINGISTLMASTIERGTAHRTDQQIAEEVTHLQADIDGVAGRNFIGLRMEMVGRNFDGALDLFLDILFHPRFGEKELRQEKKVLLRELETQKDYFEVATGNHFLQKLYPSHPYGLNVLGNVESLSKLKQTQIQQHYQAYVRPERMVIAVAGDLDPKLLRKKLESKLPKPTKGGEGLASPPAVPKLTELHEIRRPIQGEKAYVQYGFRGTRLQSPDRFALDTLSSLLASSGGGRLYVRLREELGLVYSLDFAVGHALEEGFISVSVNTIPGRVEQVIDEVNRELKKIREQLVSAAELDRVKNFIVGAYEVDLQRAGPQAAQLCLGELYKTERTLHDYVDGILQVTPKKIREVAQQYLTPDQSVLVILSPTVN